MKNIVITIADGFHWKYLVLSKLLDPLIDGNTHLHIFLPEKLYGYLPQLKSNLNENFLGSTTFYSVRLQAPNKLRSFLVSLSPYLTRKYTETENFQKEEYSKSTISKFRNILILLFSYRVLLSLFLKFFRRTYKDRGLETILNKISIDLMVCSTPAQKLFDIPFLVYAESTKIASVSPVYSWDNLTSKGNLVLKPTYLLVWNEYMFHEAIELHGYEKSRVFVTGVPTYDAYKKIALDKNKKGCKQQFLFELGFSNIIEEYIVLTTVPRRFVGAGHLDIIESISSFLTKNKLSNTGLLVRPHPLDTTDYSSAASDTVIIDEYGSIRSTSIEKALKSWTPDPDNIQHLAKSLMYAIVNINVASTISIESALLGTPTINICYNTERCFQTEFGKIERFYKYTHYRPLIENDLVLLATSEREFEELLLSTVSLRDFESVNFKFSNTLVGNNFGESVSATSNVIRDLIATKHSL